ncbi:MAG: 30S ribosomal protein S16 [Kiritimatiellae bacterium]|nr:30S ribosomal protein S16 [Kiritimatiellia bacterium]MDD4737623.1 30S ribosomal protein S16 [Kiritimatiellia bacterium]
MAVKIRLRRMGRTNKAFFRVVVADSRSPTDGRFLENVGWYDPMKKDEDNCKLNMERIAYWKGTGAQVSDTVDNLIKKMLQREPPKAAQPAVEEVKEDAPAEA